MFISAKAIVTIIMCTLTLLASIETEVAPLGSERGDCSPPSNERLVVPIT